MAFTLMGIFAARLIQAITTETKIRDVLFNLGLPAVTAAAAGGFRVLTTKAGVLQDVTSIHQGTVVSGGSELGAKDLTRLGDHLVIDDLGVYLVFVIVLGLVLFEVRVGSAERGKAPRGPAQWTRYLGFGFIVPTFVGVSALVLVYVGS
jgi:hypothetical protein